MSSFPILSSIIFLPLFGALISMLVKGPDKDVSKNIRDLALWISIVELGLVALLCYQFNFSNGDFQNIEKKILLSKFGISYFLGVDSLSIVFILLTSLLFPICIYYTKFSIRVYSLFFSFGSTRNGSFFLLRYSIILCFL